MFPAGALLVPGATWPVGLFAPRLELPPVSEKSPGLPVDDGALVPAPTEVLPAVVDPAAPAPVPPALPPSAAKTQLEDIASAVAITIVAIFMIFHLLIVRR